MVWCFKADKFVSGVSPSVSAHAEDAIGLESYRLAIVITFGPLNESKQRPCGQSIITLSSKRKGLGPVHHETKALRSANHREKGRDSNAGKARLACYCVRYPCSVTWRPFGLLRLPQLLSPASSLSTASTSWLRRYASYGTALYINSVSVDSIWIQNEHRTAKYSSWVKLWTEESWDLITC